MFIVYTQFTNVAARRTMQRGGTRLENYALDQCFSIAGPRPGTGPREVLLEFVILVI